MAEWMPIEGAPKDGRVVRIKDADEPEGAVNLVWWDGFVWGNDLSVFTAPTHWQPVNKSGWLPSPPDSQR